MPFKRSIAPIHMDDTKMNANTIQEFSIQGMSCSGCSNRIEKALSNTPGVTRAVVNFASHSAVVESQLTPESLQNLVEKLGYKALVLDASLNQEELERREQEVARKRLVWAMILALPVIALGMAHQLSGATWVRILGIVFTGALLIFPGRGFFVKAFQLLKQKTANMDTLIALGAGLSYAWSVYQTLVGGEHIYFETAAAIVAFVLVGKFVEHRMTWRATSSLGALLRLQPVTAQRLLGESGHEVEEVDVRFVRTGDKLRARVGERFAADGVLFEGQTEVDESLLTGESLPVAKQNGASVVAGSLNLSAPVVYRAEFVGPQTRLGEIVAFVERTQLSKAPIQRIADKVSAVFVPIILALSAATFVVWNFLFGVDSLFALNAAVSVLVVACPCALGLATPIAVSIATSRAARLGLLFRDLSALEALQSVQALVLDKTGTMTEGRLKVIHEHRFGGAKPSDAIYRAMESLEKASLHPVAVAIVSWIENLALASSEYPVLTNRSEAVGTGVQADVVLEGSVTSIQLGRCDENELKLLPDVGSATWVVCRVNDKPLVALALTDSLRPAAKSMLADLRKMGVEPVLASGDRQAVVQEMAHSLGIQGFGEQSPQMKAQYVAGLQAQGKRVAMLGDGINDAPALARADVGIAMGSGTDAAKQTAAITLKNATLPNVLTAFRLSKATFRNIKQNLVWAFGYNIVLIPIAIAGKLTPMWAAAAMAFSSVFVVLNSLRLLRFESRDTE